MLHVLVMDTPTFQCTAGAAVVEQPLCSPTSWQVGVEVQRAERGLHESAREGPLPRASNMICGSSGEGRDRSCHPVKQLLFGILCGQV